MANKAATTGDTLLPRIEGRIQVLRGLRVMIDADLANLYGIQTKVLNQAVKLGSPRAIAVNIEVMRTFVRVRACTRHHAQRSGPAPR